MQNNNLPKVLDQLFGQFLNTVEGDVTDNEEINTVYCGFQYAISLTDGSSDETKAKFLKRYQKSMGIYGEPKLSERELMALSHVRSFGNVFYAGKHYNTEIYLADEEREDLEEVDIVIMGVDKACKKLFGMTKTPVFWWKDGKEHFLTLCVTCRGEKEQDPFIMTYNFNTAFLWDPMLIGGEYKSLSINEACEELKKLH